MNSYLRRNRRKKKTSPELVRFEPKEIKQEDFDAFFKSYLAPRTIRILPQGKE